MPEKFSRNTLGKILENLRHEIIFSDDYILPNKPFAKSATKIASSDFISNIKQT